jgi:hypothetical protein
MSVSLIAHRSNLPFEDMGLQLGVIDQASDLLLVQAFSNFAERLTGDSHNPSLIKETSSKGMNFPTSG